MSQSFQYNQYDEGFNHAVADAPADARATFIRLTYLHVAGAILAFLGLELFLFNSPFGNSILQMFVRSQGMGPLLFLMIAFVGVGYLAQYMARSASSVAVKYAGLGLYVVLQAIIFFPLLYMADRFFPGKNLIATAGIYTGCLFGGLTLAAVITRKDFSFLGPIISIAGFLMIGLILCSILFPASIGLGMWFSFLGIALAAASVLYSTSNIMLHYPTDQHVAAALELFASIALMFYYILRLLMATSSRD